MTEMRDQAPKPLSCHDDLLRIETADNRWHLLLPQAESLARHALDTAMAVVKEPTAVRLADSEITRISNELDSLDSLSVILTDNDHLRALNSGFRHIDKPTNVLSFKTPLGPAHTSAIIDSFTLSDLWAGDIFIALETAEREARDQGKSFRDHVIHLIIHGFLHLIGYDHEGKEDARTMEIFEVTILKALGVQNPYD